MMKYEAIIKICVLFFFMPLSAMEGQLSQEECWVDDEQRLVLLDFGYTQQDFINACAVLKSRGEIAHVDADDKASLFFAELSKQKGAGVEHRIADLQEQRERFKPWSVITGRHAWWPLGVMGVCFAVVLVVRSPCPS